KRREGIDVLDRKQKWRRIGVKIIFFITLIFSIITLLFVGALVLPFFFTNAIPMILAYIFMVMTYAYVVVTLIMIFLCYRYITNLIYPKKKDEVTFMERQMKRLAYNPQIILQAAFRLLPYLVSILFNLSQFLYYGSDYLGAISLEADKRDPSAYFERVLNSPQMAHTVLSSI
ncbi:unnamed protein product, partial [Adineta ricciae]